MRFWEVEFECDDSWSETNVWSVFYVQNYTPTEIQINEILKRKGIEKMIRVLEITEDEFYDDAQDYFFDVPKEIVTQIENNLLECRGMRG